jgi:hemerythrin-like domain-containing protein
MSPHHPQNLSPTTSEGHRNNDTRGWMLVHDQIRAVIADASNQVSNVRADDPSAANTLVAWWLSFSRSFVHHMRTEDDRIWPTLAGADPQQSAELEMLTSEHREIASRAAAVDIAMRALPDRLRTVRLEHCRTDLLERLGALESVVTRHLAHEEMTAFATGREAVHPGEWSRIERDMVKGLALRDVATLAPRILERADDTAREMMLGRLPRPMRLIVVRVFVPRYRRTRTALPAARAASSD